ncbi:MAG: hypothetical protein JWP63_2677 [Candidatus Solibacter sp.]|nr:hypothetical protein [Candidatus Solibacter sp.]
MPTTFRSVPVRVGLLVLALSRLWAEDLTLFVNGRIGESCRAAIAAPVIQEAIETQLRDAGFPLAKARTATLGSEIDCVSVKVEKMASQKVSARQCVSLSQIVSVPSEVRTALATTWRQCQSYTCAGKGCEPLALAAARNLVGAFIAAQRERSAREMKAVAGAVAAVDRTASAPLPPDLKFPYYCLYIMTCMAVLFRWQWVRHAH